MKPRTILITGATRGLGRALVAEFARLGHVVLGCGRKESEIAALAKAFPAPHQFRAVDVASDPAVKSWAEEALARGEPLDLLLNNAAVVNRNAPLWNVSAAEFDQVVDVNLKGVVNVLRHFLPAMIRQGRGIVVNFSSGWGRTTDAEVAPYCATKWAIEGLTQALAQELPAGLAAIPLNPGIINTEMLRSCFGASAARFPDPEEWARVAVPFLLQLGPADNGKPLTVPVRGATH
jgi:NAD(P)-dependent dehydrogenase (short-subunit alcohol dehydrogenase family)